MMEVKKLRFAYGNRWVLEDITFTATSGQMVCVLGPNGTGKSTLFKCMLGLLREWSGEILLDGKDVRQMKPMERARKMAYIPQATNPAFSYSVLDMVSMGTTAHLRGLHVPGKKERETAEQALERLGMTHLVDREYGTLSGGEQQLVLIARALAQGSKTLIMDEPTSSLDYGNQLKVELRLQELARDGYLVIQSMHSPDQAYRFADSIIGIAEGRVVAKGAPQDVMDEKFIEKLYHVPVRRLDTADGSGRFFEVIE